MTAVELTGGCLLPLERNLGPNRVPLAYIEHCLNATELLLQPKLESTEMGYSVIRFVIKIMLSSDYD